MAHIFQKNVMYCLGNTKYDLANFNPFLFCYPADKHVSLVVTRHLRRNSFFELVVNGVFGKDFLIVGFK